MTSPRNKVLLSWSSGKDSAWPLHVLRQQADVEAVGFLTTFNEDFDRVAMDAVRRELVEAQAATASLTLFPVMLPLSLLEQCLRGTNEGENRRGQVKGLHSHGEKDSGSPTYEMIHDSLLHYPQLRYRDRRVPSHLIQLERSGK